MAKIEIPAELRGTPEQQIKQLRTYLFRMAEILNVTLDAIESKSDQPVQEIQGSGKAGKDGKDGRDGRDGKDGANGADGQPGKDGKSAYESAQAGGYTGTEAEFYTALAQSSRTGPIYPMSV